MDGIIEDLKKELWYIKQRLDLLENNVLKRIESLEEKQIGGLNFFLRDDIGKNK